MTGTVTEVVSQMSKEERTSRKEARIARRELRKANKAARKEKKELRKAKEEEKNRLNDAIEEGWEEDTKWRNNRRDLFNDTIAEMRNGETLETKNQQGDTALGRKIRHMAEGTGRKYIPGTEEISKVWTEYFQTSEVGTDMQEAKLDNLKTNFVAGSTSRIYREVNTSRLLTRKEDRQSFFYDNDWFDGEGSRFDQITDDAMSGFDARMASKLVRIRLNEERIEKLLNKKFMPDSRSLNKLRNDNADRQFLYNDICLDYSSYAYDEEPEWCQQKRTYESEENKLLLKEQRMQKEIDVVNILGRQHFEDSVANCLKAIDLADLTRYGEDKQWQDAVTTCQQQPIDEMAKIVNDVNLEFCQSSMDSVIQAKAGELGITVDDISDICDLYISPVV